MDFFFFFCTGDLSLHPNNLFLIIFIYISVDLWNFPLKFGFNPVQFIVQGVSALVIESLCCWLHLLYIKKFLIYSPIVAVTGEGNGNPLQCSCLENPRDRAIWWAAICGATQSRTPLKQLSSSNSSSCCYYCI